MIYYTHKKISNGVQKKFKSIFLSLLTVILAVIIIFTIVKAGSLNPTASPAATFYTLTDIYNRLTTNSTATEADHSFSPAAASPASSMYTLKQIYEAIPTIVANTVKLGTSYLGVAGTLTPDGGTAAVADLFNSKTAHLTNDWTLDTGTLDLACNTATFDGTANKVANAYDGGGDGTNRYCMTESGTATAGDMRVGIVAWVDGEEITGTAGLCGTRARAYLPSVPGYTSGWCTLGTDCYSTTATYCWGLISNMWYSIKTRLHTSESGEIATSTTGGDYSGFKSTEALCYANSPNAEFTNVGAATGYVEIE